MLESIVIISWIVSIFAIVLAYFVGYKHGRIDAAVLSRKGKKL